VRVAVVTEDLTWTATIQQYLSNPAIYPAVLGPNVNVTYQARIPETAVDLSSYAAEIIASKARIIVHVFSGRVGAYFAGTWGQAQIKAIPVGINVLAQLQTYWTDTGEFCEYESFLNFVGTDTPINALAEQFWDDFTAYTGGIWPIYTAYGAYNGIYLVKEALEIAGTTDADALVSTLEAIDTTALTGQFKFTAGTGSLLPQITSVPHDSYTISFDPFWPEPQYTRAFIVQWQAGRMEVVSPMDQPYSKAWAMPPWMRPIIADLDLNGRVDILDIAKAAIAFGSYPGHERWDIETDIDGNADINIIDIAQIAMRFGETVELPIED
jgi:branched-chain amino acid transport system substrate-binding protein